MKITNLECWEVDLKLGEPYTIAYETIDKCSNVFLRAETNDGIVGYGCAAPDLVITNETSKTVLEFFTKTIHPLLLNSDPFRYVYIIEELKKVLPNSPSAVAMADMLLFDLASKKAGVPLYKFLGGYRKSIATSITIGIMSVNDTVKRAKNYVDKGFKILKIKGGLNVDEDIERIMKLREIFGDNIKLRFDANQGYTVEQAIKFVSETRAAKLELIEQPTARDKFDWLGEVSKKVHIPVMADESLMNLIDVFKLTRRDLTDMINVKIMKVGGILEALHINSVGKAAGVEVMVGCMDESALGISAGLHYALSRPNVIYADLDGHLDLIEDPATDCIVLRNGVLYPNDKNGLGLTELK